MSSQSPIAIALLSCVPTVLHGCGGAAWTEHAGLRGVENAEEVDRRTEDLAVPPPMPPMPVVAPPMPVIAPPIPTFSIFMGCYKDSPSRAFDGGAIRVGKDINTFQNCRRHCLDQGSHFMALQHGDECWCGDNFRTDGEFSQVFDHECNMMANHCEFHFGCGNDWRNSVFDITATATTTTTTEYFFASGGQSCSQACNQAGQDCHPHAIAVAAQSVDNCKRIIESLGMTPQRGGLYGNDDAGCTYHPHQEGWFQVMRRNTEPQCNVVNADPWRQRVCACRTANPWKSQPWPTTHMGATFLGCYADNANRAFKGGHVRVGQDGNTFENCMNHCLSQGASFMGVQHGDACFCGDFRTDGEFKMVATEECNQMADMCGVQHLSTTPFGCGGAWRNSIWEITTELWEHTQR